MLLLAAAMLNAPQIEKEPRDKVYFVGGRFYTQLSMVLACDYLGRDGKRYGNNITVQSNDEPNEPTVDMTVQSTLGDQIIPNNLKGKIAFSLPMTSSISISIPLEKTDLYNERFVNFVETFDFSSDKVFYNVFVGGTKEDLTSIDAVGFCRVDSIKGVLQEPEK